MTSLVSITNQISETLRSDKSDAYLDFYEDMFRISRAEKLNILEVGVFQGGSLLMFAEYFANARLLGIDVKQPPSEFYEALIKKQMTDRVHVELGSQSDTRFLQQAIQRSFGDEQLDIVIDDASHLYRHTKKTFEFVFYNHLKSGGYYIIEDWGCGYWPRWRDGHPNGKHGLPRFIKELVDLTALKDRTKLFRGRRAMRTKEELQSPIAKMIVIPSIVALIKA